MTEMEILARRRELVVLSAQLQRTTLVRRLDHVQQHPVNAAIRLVAGVASVPLLFKVGSLVAHKVSQKKRRMNKTEKRRFSVRPPCSCFHSSQAGRFRNPRAQPAM